jgi:cytoskeleton protein RodZ
VSEPTPGPGADLKAAREGLQVSIREVADALNLPARVIEALETDDYDRLPPTVFTRGYLRSYARLLELPSDELLARYPEVTEEVEIAVDSRTGTHMAVSASRKRLLPVSIGVIIVLAMVVWLFGRDQDRPAGHPSEQSVPESVAPEPAASEARTPADLEEPTMPSAEPAPVVGPTPAD